MYIRDTMRGRKPQSDSWPVWLSAHLGWVLVALPALGISASCNLIGGIEIRTLVVCISGTTRCAEGGREVCTEAGEWSVSACPVESALCSGEGECVACVEADGVVIDPTPVGDCRVVVCEGGLAVEMASDTDVAADVAYDCLRPTCDGLAPTLVPDDDDHEDRDACSIESCADGELILEPAGAPDWPCALAASTGSFQFTCARSFAGEVRCWGANDLGQLGIGVADTDVHAVPIAVPGLPPAAALATGGSHACAVLRDGTLRCWGENGFAVVTGIAPGPPEPAPVAVDLPARARNVATAIDHSCALLEDHTVWCWGDNQFGQLGDGTTRGGFQGVFAIDMDDESGRLHDVIEVATTQAATCALKSDGVVKCWGSFGAGELGSEGPMTVFSEAAQIVSGAYHFCVRGFDSAVACWGGNSYFQSGDSSSTVTFPPHLITGLSATDVSGGFHHTCAVTDSGVVCWGGDQYGELGRNAGCAESPGAAGCYSVAPAEVVGLDPPIDDLRALWEHSCAIAQDEVRCWGRNDAGQLGDGTNINRGLPTQVLWSGD